jgi:hypothetical protein
MSQKTPSSPVGFTWRDYVDWLAHEAGSLAAAAEQLSARHQHRDDTQSIERALRRLRARTRGDGGKWGGRALAAFGLPGAAEQRARWMGAYHSRFTDLPVPVCEDLVRLWDRPPLSQSRQARVWLSLAHGSCALRRDDPVQARVHLASARTHLASAPPEAHIELLLVEAYLASRHDPAAVVPLLERAQPLLSEVQDETQRACLQARWVDQRAYDLNRQRPPDYPRSEALYRAIPPDSPSLFVRCRRANGLAYLCWKQGRPDEAVALAREACRHAGDGGHLRLRVMALAMLARVSQGEEAADAHRRASAIAASLEDETLRLRLLPSRR